MKFIRNSPKNLGFAEFFRARAMYLPSRRIRKSQVCPDGLETYWSNVLRSAVV